MTSQDTGYPGHAALMGERRLAAHLTVLLASLALAALVALAPTPALAGQSSSLAAGAKASASADKVSYKPMYRLYNPFSGEHFYTASKKERKKLVKVGWHYEGPGWMAPSAGDEVYRLYNQFSGDHLYTLSKKERKKLQKLGWTYEGVGWHSCKANDDERIALQRQYNPNAQTGTHNYTIDESEVASLVKEGWKDEGICWYGREVGASFKDDMEPWRAHISGDVALDTQLDMIYLAHDTLRSCYDYVATFTYRAENEFYGNPHFLPDDMTIGYAREMIAEGSGNCYRFSSLFCWLARGLGYDAQVVSGWVPSHSGGQAPHGWVEVTVDGQTLVCDPDMYEAVPYRDWYLVTYDAAPVAYGSW